VANVHLAARLMSDRPRIRPFDLAHRQHLDLRFAPVQLDYTRVRIHSTSNPHDIVHGVLFDVPQSQVSSLAHAEGEGTDYDRNLVWVEVTNGELVRRAETYIAKESKIDQNMKPYGWYLDLVTTGALMHELPQTYVDALRNVRAKPDLNLKRPPDLKR